MQLYIAEIIQATGGYVVKWLESYGQLVIYKAQHAGLVAFAKKI